MGTFFEWAWRIILTGLVAGNIFWVKRWINAREKWEDKHQEKEETYLKEGGIVTRDKFFEFCGGMMAKCPLFDRVSHIINWKTEIFSKGGAMTKDDHSLSEEKLVTRFISGVKDFFSEHNRMVDDRLAGIKTVIEANAKNVDLVMKGQLDISQRIDQHLEAHAKK